ncbi:hypothetical protein Adt_23908 [Abeliophyllum distichum]|uniref:Uncharacterized protein n=1 Tax=Abeliophyllum distichum TaxID=126358 RepID=A0ABD1SD88_9LAMI
MFSMSLFGEFNNHEHNTYGVAYSSVVEASVAAPCSPEPEQKRGLGQRDGEGGGNVVRRDGAGTHGSDDGGFSLAEKPLNGLSVSRQKEKPWEEMPDLEPSDFLPLPFLEMTLLAIAKRTLNSTTRHPW